MLTAVLIVLATISSVYGVYFLARLVLGSNPNQETRDLAASILFRIAALHSLVLALVFASEVVDYHQLSFESAVETNAVSDAYYDAIRYGEEETGAIQAALRNYLSIAANSEWESLGKTGDLLDSGWEAWGIAYDAALELDPQTARHESIRDNLLDNLSLVSDSRDLREYQAKSSLSSLFWIAAISGVLLLSIGYFPFPPIRENLILLGAFATYTGFVLFTTYAMSNPYRMPAALDPVLFHDLAQELGN